MVESKQKEAAINNLDNVFLNIGEIGFYQFIIFMMAAFMSSMSAIVAYSTVFTNATPDFRCKLPMWSNDTYEVKSDYHQYLINEFIPLDKNKKFDGCYLKSYDWSNDSLTNFTLNKCDSWVYSKKYFHETIITKWNYVCDNIYEKSLYSSLYFSGYFFIIVLGLLADRFGRKKIAYIFLIANLVVNSLTAIVTNVPINEKLAKGLYGALRLLVGITSNVYNIAVVLAIEMVGPKYRVTASNTVYYFYILGEFICLLLGYFIRDYRNFYISIAIFSSIYVFYFWSVPESPRYLANRQRYIEADKVFDKIAKSNKKEYKSIFSDQSENNIQINQLPKSIYKSQQKKNTFKKSLKNFFTFKNILKILACLINWFSNTFVYDGLSFNIGILDGDPYLNYLYSTLVELAGIAVSHFALQKFGRKIPYTINLTIATISLLTIAFIPKDNTKAINALVMVGKFSISFTFNAIYVITAESYPTVIRNTALSFCSSISRIGGVIAPYVQLLGTTVWYPLPFIIYGSTAFVGVATYCLLLTETKDTKLPETLDETE